MSICYRPDGELEIFPSACEFAQPTFPSDVAYQQFREDFTVIMRPAIRDSNRRHALSELDERNHGVD